MNKLILDMNNINCHEYNFHGIHGSYIYAVCINNLLNYRDALILEAYAKNRLSGNMDFFDVFKILSGRYGIANSSIFFEHAYALEREIMIREIVRRSIFWNGVWNCVRSFILGLYQRGFIDYNIDEYFMTEKFLEFCSNLEDYFGLGDDFFRRRRRERRDFGDDECCFLERLGYESRDNKEVLYGEWTHDDQSDFWGCEGIDVVPFFGGMFRDGRVFDCLQVSEFFQEMFCGGRVPFDVYSVFFGFFDIEEEEWSDRVFISCFFHTFLDYARSFSYCHNIC